ncbi:MAG: sulfate permease [Ignavibacteriales bacterium]|nr:sulfate permease [Ignavibacteriales bacterium]
MFKGFQPKLIGVLRGPYTKENLLSDLTAGVIVGIVALPLAIAFAIASGVKPEQGLYTAIIAGLAVSVFGGSRVQIAGPTGAFVVIVYRIVQTHGYDGLMVATIIAGVLLLAMGLARFGTLLKFVPYPLTVGFTSGIAIIIFSSQINDFLGLRIENLSPDFVEKWTSYAEHLPSFDLSAFGVGLGSLGVIILSQRFVPRIPGSLLAIIGSTIIVSAFSIPVETIGTRFGAVANTFPPPRIPEVSWSTITGTFSPAVTLAMLGAIESLLSAVVADGMIRSRHRPNMELVAQGAANVLSPLFGGIPATGAIARTATNIKSGGRTPVAGIVHAITLLLIMLFFGSWASLIPMPTLAAILIVVSYNMSEWHSFVKLLKAPRGDVAVLLITFGLTVVVDLTAAIQTGVILSAMLFIRRMAEVSQTTLVTKELRDEEEQEGEVPQKENVLEGVEVFQVQGSLFFGAVEQFTETIRSLEKKPKVFILDAKNLLAIDASGLRALEDLAAELSHQGTRLIISGIHKQPLFAATQSGLLDRVGEENICGTLAEAFRKATEQQKVIPVG